MSSSVVGQRQHPPRRSNKSKKKSTMIIREQMDRAQGIIDRLEKDSPFFGGSNGRAVRTSVPTFDGTDIHRGEILGEGEFSTVCEIVKFVTDDQCKCSMHGGAPALPSDLTDGIINTKVLRLEGSKGNVVDIDDDDAEGNDNEGRGFMKEHCFREGSARYAVKQLKPTLADEQRSEAIIDIAMEAKFLEVLSHSNIVKMRATGGVPCHPKFFLVLDRLYDTLEVRIDDWAAEKKKLKGKVFGILGKQKEELRHLFSDRLLAALDIARAMSYLHKHNIIYRDLKPENIGFDVRGDAKIFDFGLAKELLPRDMVAPPDQYRASGLTGSRRYMAPEVALCKPYGPKADVFSYTILLWEIIALKVPFSGYDVERHAELVVNRGKRPKVSSSWPVFLRTMMEEGWSAKPSERPAFEVIRDVLRGELMMLEGSMSGDIANRSTHLFDRSNSSRHGEG